MHHKKLRLPGLFKKKQFIAGSALLTLLSIRLSQGAVAQESDCSGSFSFVHPGCWYRHPDFWLLAGILLLMIIGIILWRMSVVKQLNQLQNAQTALQIFNAELCREIQERQQIEQKLRQSESKLAEAQKVAHIGSWEFDLRTECITWSEEMFIIFGFDPTQPEPSYAELLQRIHPEDRTLWHQTVENAMTTGASYSVDHRVILLDGSVRYIEGRGEAEIDRQGQVIRLFGTGMDITDRKRAEIALRESEERFRAIFEQAAVGICVDSLNNMPLQMNQRFCDIAGYSADEIRSLHWTERTHPDDREVDWAQMQQLLAGKIKNFSLEKRYVRKDRSWVWVNLTVSLIYDAVGKPQSLLAIVQDISEAKRLEVIRQQTEAALRQSEERLSLALGAAKAGIWQWWMGKEQAFWSQENFRLLGYQPESCQPCYENWMKAVHPDDRELAEQQVQKALEDKTDLNCEFRVVLPDGSIRWIADVGRIVYDEQGKPTGMIGIQIDITDRQAALHERQQAEAALQEKEEQLRLALDFTQIGMWDWHIQSERLLWNKNTAQLLNLPLDQLEVTIQAWIDRVHPDDRALVGQKVMDALEAHTIYDAEYRVVWQDGTVRWLLGKGRGIYNESGQAVRMVGVVLDITDQQTALHERQRAEAALQQLNQELETRVKNRTAALQQSEERFRQLAENINEVFWLLDLQQMQVLYVSPAYERIWGKTVESLYKSGTSWSDAIHPDDRQQILLGSQRYYTGFDQEYRIIQPNGTIRWVRDRAFPILDETGQIRRVAGVAEDITERKQAEQEIYQLNEALSQQNRNLETLVAQRTAELLNRTRQLEATNRELESFSYSVSHDLRAPSRHIHGFVNVLKQHLEQQPLPDESSARPRIDTKTAHYLDVIESSSRKMGLLIDGLLTLSRVGRRQMDRRPVSLRPLVDEAIESVRLDVAGERPIEFRIGDLPVVNGDAVLLQQVLLNLIGNAIKFSRNTATPCIEIGSLPDQTIFVRDNGVGFAMDDADHIFDAFQRLHGRDFEGTGIGLAIVQRIIHRHNGDIWAESQPNQGATFYFRLAQ